MALGEKQQSVLVAACQTGTYDALSEADRQSAVKLHEKGYLARDPKVSGRWYPTSAAHEFTGRATGQAVPVVANSDRAIASIIVGKRLRTLSEEKVAALMASIPEHGLRNPISVYGLASDEVVELSAGEHRLEAMRRLGYETVPCVHYQGDALDRELWEIDENLIRSDLTPADRALFVFRRKEIYLLKHPETAKGVSQGEGGRTALDPRRQVGDEVKRFTAATAEATGQSERSIQRDAERGEKVSERALRMISATPLNTGATLDRLKRLEPEQQIAWIEGALADRRETEAKAKQFRTEKMQMSRTIRADIVKAIADKGTAVAGKMPRAAFPIGYVDPPWQQEAWSDETGQDKGLMYPSMPLDEIKALCAGDASPFTPDAVLWLWVPFNRIDDGIDVLEAWGFEHVSAIVWDKVDIGMGRWVRDRAEMVLIGKRGKISLAPEMGTQPPSLYSEKKGEHSRKPVWFAEQLDGLYPDMPKLELFQRKESLAEGDIRLSGKWSFWGFEALEGVEVNSFQADAEAIEGAVLSVDQPLQDLQPQKAKPEKADSYTAQRKASSERKKAYRSTIPELISDDDLIMAAKGNLSGYHRAVTHGHEHDMVACGDKIAAIADHLFGVDPDYDWGSQIGGGPPKGSGRFSCLRDAHQWLMSKLAASAGEVPMFGQPGRFVIELFGCRVDFQYDGLFGLTGGDARVIDLNKPFFSETGYRSFQVCPDGYVIHAGGLDIRAYMERVCTAQFTEGGKRKVKLHNPPFGVSISKGDDAMQLASQFIIDRRAKDPAYQAGGHLYEVSGE